MEKYEQSKRWLGFNLKNGKYIIENTKKSCVVLINKCIWRQISLLIKVKTHLQIILLVCFWHKFHYFLIFHDFLGKSSLKSESECWELLCYLFKIKIWFSGEEKIDISLEFSWEIHPLVSLKSHFTSAWVKSASNITKNVCSSEISSISKEEDDSAFIKVHSIRGLPLILPTILIMYYYFHITV